MSREFMNGGSWSAKEEKRPFFNEVTKGFLSEICEGQGLKLGKRFAALDKIIWHR